MAGADQPEGMGCGGRRQRILVDAAGILNLALGVIFCDFVPGRAAVQFLGLSCFDTE